MPREGGRTRHPCWRTENRGSVVGGIGRIMTVAQEAQMQRETGQTSMFDLLGAGEVTPLPGLEIEHIETPSLEVLGWERELLGACVSDHPFREASLVLGQYVTHAAADIESLAGRRRGSDRRSGDRGCAN